MLDADGMPKPFSLLLSIPLFCFNIFYPFLGSVEINLVQTVEITNSMEAKK